MACFFFYIFCQAEDPILPAQTMKQEGCVVQECGKDQKMPRLFGHRYFNLRFGKPYITKKMKKYQFSHVGDELQRPCQLLL